METLYNQATMSTNAVEIQDVTKTFSTVTAVDSLSLHVPQGSIYGFIGPNGSGKTTTLRMILNIFYPDAGKIALFGQSRMGSCVDQVGYLPEERGLYKKMKVRDLLLFLGRLKKAAELKKDIQYWLERFELTDWAKKKVETLSKGMAQKVQFIASVAARPKLLILDEPFSGLDPVNTDVLHQAVLDLRAKGTTIVFSTHDMNMAEKMCDFICMIHKGRKVLDGTLTSIQQECGQDIVRIRTEGGMKTVDNLDGIESVKDFGQMQELRIGAEADTQAILKQLIDRTPVYQFEITRPSLHDIFVQIAKPSDKEADHA